LLPYPQQKGLSTVAVSRAGLRQVFPDRFKNQGLKKGLAFYPLTMCLLLTKVTTQNYSIWPANIVKQGH